jgi:hypothetical protein
MASTAFNRDLVEVVAEEMAHGVKNAVDCWMTEIDLALSNTRLTTLGRLNAVREIATGRRRQCTQSITIFSLRAGSSCWAGLFCFWSHTL